MFLSQAKVQVVFLVIYSFLDKDSTEFFQTLQTRGNHIIITIIYHIKRNGIIQLLCQTKKEKKSGEEKKKGDKKKEVVFLYAVHWHMSKKSMFDGK
jgi:hypothetical protein